MQTEEALLWLHQLSQNFSQMSNGVKWRSGDILYPKGWRLYDTIEFCKNVFMAVILPCYQYSRYPKEKIKDNYITVSFFGDSCIEVCGRRTEKRTKTQAIHVVWLLMRKWLLKMKGDTSECRLTTIFPKFFLSTLCMFLTFVWGKGSCPQYNCSLICNIWLDLPCLVTILWVLLIIWE